MIKHKCAKCGEPFVDGDTEITLDGGITVYHLGECYMEARAEAYRKAGLPVPNVGGEK